MLVTTAPESVVRHHLESADGFDRASWQRLAAEIGVQGLAVPEEFGGAGCGLRELAVAAEELGRTLAPGPFLSTVLLSATLVASSADPAVKAAVLPGIADGTLVVTVALPAHGAGWDPTEVRVTAVPDGDEWRLTGAVPEVLDGQAADLLLMPARHGDLVSVFLVRPDAGSTTTEPRPALDRTRRFARITLASATATPVGVPGTAPELIDAAMATAGVGLAADQVGGARRMLEITTEHASTRYQFGRPIGSFQAVKHALADMLINTELARAALEDAVRAVADDAPDLAVAVATAQVVCSTAYFDVASAAIQLHGGLGFTWEHSAHLYFKRATSDRVLLGTPAVHTERLSRALGL
jgi:alkylation response protein AidB-like acyl-CoA dehydrogenase